MTTAAASDGRNGAVPWRLIGWAIPVALLSLPLILDWPWTQGDFIIAAIAFAIVGGAFELVAWRSSSKWYRGGAAIALLTALLLLWINAAVGIIGNEDNRANLMFVVVILMALAGSFSVKFQPAGMARAMAVAAGAQLLVAVIVLANGLEAIEAPGLVGVAILILGFAGMWLLSAGLFAKAARDGG